MSGQLLITRQEKFLQMIYFALSMKTSQLFPKGKEQI